MSAAAQHTCETPECGKKATLQCPTCLKMGIQGSFFCGQECFKGYWKSHKIIHLLASESVIRTKHENSAETVSFQSRICLFFHPLFFVVKQKVPALLMTSRMTNIVRGRITRLRVNCDHFRKRRSAKCLTQFHDPTMLTIQMVVRSARNRFAETRQSKCWTMRKSKQ